MERLVRAIVGWLIVAGAALVAGVFVILAGCQSPSEAPPKVYPVKGVVKKKGGGPIAEGTTIEFRLESNPTFMMVSAVKDGAFELHTIFGNQKLPGGAAGACNVMVHLPMKSGDLMPPDPFRLPQPIKIEEKANDLVIEIE
jgi:hypothetical protein